MKAGDNLYVVFRNEIPENELSLDKHGQGRGLHTSNGEFLTVREGVRARKIHPNQPIRTAAATSSIG
jgi:hypothetical protein